MIPSTSELFKTLPKVPSNIPMPGETIIASAYVTDESVALMTLALSPPYYRVHLDGTCFMHRNIVEAAEQWKELTQ